MRFSLNPRYWFQKRSSDFAIGKAEISNRMRYNALYMLDPDVLVRHLSAFAAGDIAGLEHVIEDFENRDDKMKIGAFKMAAAVASKPWEVRIAKGEEDNERARLHKDVLTRFWNRIEVTDAFCRNRKGGVRLLVKQMMSAQSRVYAVHDLVWNVRGDGELTATFTQIPAWCFENRTGELRYLREPGAYTGEPMRAGEWLVTVGEGVGVTAAILAMSKRLSWNDWLLFSEKCGMPLILGNTGAKENSPAWNALLSAIAAIAPKTGILTDLNSKMQAVQIGGSSGQATYKDLVETVDRAISALYRGGDLATMSSTQGEGTGSDAQDGESELMDGDGCAMVSETLHNQIDRFVIRFSCGDFEPLAGIIINPPAETTDIDREIKIDQHLGEFGVRLSKKDMLARYGRTEAKDDNDAAERKIPQQTPGMPGFANEKISHIPAGQSKGAGQRQTGEDQGKASEDVLKAFAQDTGPAADAIQEFLKDPSKEAAEALLNRLPDLIPEDPAMAAVIAEAMAGEFSVKLANETQNWHKCPKCGKFSGFDGHCGKCNFTLSGNNAKHRTAALLDAAARNAYAKPVTGLAYREGLGRIDLPVGKLGDFVDGERKHGTGLSKIRAKHDIDLASLPDTLTFGEVLKTRHYDKPENPVNPNRMAIVHKGFVCFLQKNGEAWEITTHYKPKDDTVANLKTIAEAL